MTVFGELKMHSLSDIVGMGFSFIKTKLFFPKATLVRSHFHFRGNKKNFKYTEGFATGHNCRFELYNDGVVTMGKNCRIGDNVHIVASQSVVFGEECLLASKVFVSDTSHGAYSGNNQTSPLIPPNDRPLVSKPILIGDNVWLGENVVVLAGVTIGKGTIVGANSTVTKSLPENCIAAGSPAKVIKQFDENNGRWERVFH